jgi:hypothetical protein
MIAADQPDRNLRFILGHAFTLDKLRLRVLEIQTEINNSENDAELPTFTAVGPRRVSFSNNAKLHSTTKNRSPPPGGEVQLDSSSDDGYEEDDEGEDDDEDEGLSLRRFESASVQPPRMIEDEDSDGEDDRDEPVSPPPLPTELELQTITEGPESEDLAELYHHVKGCACSAEHSNAPGIKRAWEIPQKPGYQGNRVAVVEVAG